MKQFLEDIKNLMDVIGTITGTALAIYGILIGGVLNMILIGITSVVIGYGIRLILLSMKK
jgi:hypothetical protein